MRTNIYNRLERSHDTDASYKKEAALFSCVFCRVSESTVAHTVVCWGGGIKVCEGNGVNKPAAGLELESVEAV